VPKAVKDAIKIKLICLRGAMPTFIFTTGSKTKLRHQQTGDETKMEYTRS